MQFGAGPSASNQPPSAVIDPRGVIRDFGLNLPHDIGDAGGPVFAEPWQAEAFALTVRLHAAGCFTWTEWADTLADVLRGVPDQ